MAMLFILLRDLQFMAPIFAQVAQSMRFHRRIIGIVKSRARKKHKKSSGRIVTASRERLDQGGTGAGNGRVPDGEPRKASQRNKRNVGSALRQDRPGLAGQHAGLVERSPRYFPSRRRRWRAC